LLIYFGSFLQIIGQNPLINTEASRRFLLEKTQHQIGGFGKCPGNPPGISF
jgi:geranylgeranyl transferase type-1 subunit beta